MLTAVTTHLGITSDWAVVDVAIAGLFLTVIGMLWRIAVKAAKRDVLLAEMPERFTKEFGGNGNGIRQTVDQIARVQSVIQEDVAEIKSAAKYQTARLDEHIAQHETPRTRARRTA